MNKRIKKKRELEDRLMLAEMHIGFLFDQNKQLWEVIERNVSATNAELDKLQREIKNQRKNGFKNPFKK